MSAVLLVSLVLALVAVGWSVLLLARSGEMRFGLLTILFALIAIGQTVALRSQWGYPLGADLPTAAAIAGLLACALGLLVLGAVADMGAERDRMEALHWNSMETVRALGQLTVKTRCDLDGKLRGLLEIGCGYLGLEVGIISRVHEDRSEIVAIRASEDCPIERGAVFALGETFCRNVVRAERPIAIPRIRDSSWAEDPARSAFGFEAYVGAAIPVRGEVYGALCFASTQLEVDLAKDLGIARAPGRLSMRTANLGIDADTLARVFEPFVNGASRNTADAPRQGRAWDPAITPPPSGPSLHS